ncbi:hypothetical protein JOC75_003060 [Metabacillus crassostreae]|uniref:Fur-regulated basic protein FbpA n=1 Tax=Metabacillus crassostreae TaxID=929098 RepID=UPI0019594C38|nr:Fur-regulated basic protein FbpA [Metabacillus crassostreae]MBM7605056.1 hypothetical protein [Metabacillus crassostreae]
MGELFKKAIKHRKEQTIQLLIKLDCYKSIDNRQLYELTLSELENEYKLLTGRHVSDSI